MSQRLSNETAGSGGKCTLELLYPGSVEAPATGEVPLYEMGEMPLWIVSHIQGQGLVSIYAFPHYELAVKWAKGIAEETGAAFHQGAFVDDEGRLVFISRIAQISSMETVERLLKDRRYARRNLEWFMDKALEIR